MDIFGIVKNITIPAEYLPNSLEHGTWFDGSSFAGDPRAILKRVLEEARAMGFAFKTGPELEFFLFKKDNGDVKPLPHDKAGYFDLTTDEAYFIRQEMTEALEKFGIRVEASHHEVAHGQHEIDFKYDDALKTADSATTLRFVLKRIAQRHGLHATFMPKPIAGINGSGMHVHQSLADIHTGSNAFFSADGMCAVLSPTVNSYKRLVAGYEAPVYISWARTNRSALIRIPRYFKGKTQATRLELRSPDPSANIYLAFAVMLKAGLDGIRRNLAAPEPIEEDVYHFNGAKLKELNIRTLPATLSEALDEMRKSAFMRGVMGEHAFEKYIEAKQQEWDSFRTQVTQWELDTYLGTY